MKEHVQFDFIADNYFTELKEIEIRNERMNQVNTMDPYVGKYFSIDYMRRQVLKQTETEIKEIDKQIESERNLVLLLIQMQQKWIPLWILAMPHQQMTCPLKNNPCSRRGRCKAGEF